jgi:hypothetical protein
VLDRYLLGENAADAELRGENNLGDTIPPDLTAHTPERLIEFALEGLNSGPATEMTRADWDDLRRRVAERLGARRGG